MNLYIASTLDWREQGIQLRMETRYPETGDIRITVEAAKPRRRHHPPPHSVLAARDPWSTVNGENIHHHARPGSF